MVLLLCVICKIERVYIKWFKNYVKFCWECFIRVFEDEIYYIIILFKLFYFGEKVVIGVFGGKDLIVLVFVFKIFNEWYGYGLDFVLLSIDEGIIGYWDDFF